MEEAPPRVLLVLPTRSYRARAFLRAVERAGAVAVVASNEASSLAAFMDGRLLTLELGDPHASADRAEQFARQHPVAAVIGVDESAVMGAAAVAERLGVRHHPPMAVARTRDKRLLRAALASARVPQPAFVELRTDWSEAALCEVVDQAGIGYPMVVKPVDLAASRGVIRVDAAAHLAVVVQRIAAMLGADPACGEGPWPLLAERFAAGPEVAIEGVVDAGTLHVLAVFDKPDPLDGPYFEETLYITPSALGSTQRGTVLALADAAVRALGLRDGAVHAEVRLGGGDAPVLIEMAARSIGGRCSGVLHFDGGRTLEDVLVAQALGRFDAAGVRRLPQAAGVLMLPIERAGRLLGVDGLDAALAIEHVDSLEISVPPGEYLQPLPEGDRYLGFAFAHAPTSAQVERALRQVRATLRVRLAPSGG